ncbi:MAG: multidrug effflux MFS transporter [Bifidobacteriaceae bacterium]|jgi:DHA1 family bicyclomycin/chloramphenicol resistance-like MFS transporter|nr:multidrug effflux MFS transporter [Bifidobacteriaceae bacterium]
MPSPELPTSRAGLIGLLGSIAALGAVAGDIYLPSMPEIAADLGTSRAWVQNTVVATLAGGALGQLVMGPLADRYGRRSPVLAGVALHVAASIGIVFTPSVGVLIALRVLQGVGNASAQVVAMAMVRDLYSGYRAAKLLSQLMLVIGVAPLLAPTLGAALAGLGSWRHTFVFLAVFGVGLALLIYLRVPDTRPEAVRARATGLGQAFRAYWVLLRDHRFMGYALIPGFAMSAMMAWVISSPFLVRVRYGQSSGAFALIFALCGVFMVAGAQANAALVHRFRPRRLLMTMLPVELGLAVAGFVFSFVAWGGLWAMVAGVAALLFVNGFVPGNASALALTRHGEAAGAASALIGCVQSGCSTAVMALLAAVGDTQRDMTAVQSGVLTLALVIVLAGGISRRRRLDSAQISD